VGELNLGLPLFCSFISCEVGSPTCGRDSFYSFIAKISKIDDLTKLTNVQPKYTIHQSAQG
jgi:hypothetical protein